MGRRIERYLTPDGEHAAANRIADEVLADCYAPLSQEERAVLLGLLRRLIGAEG